MNGKRLLLDTNVVISLLRGDAEIVKFIKNADGYRRQGIGESKRD
jgi:predicted nucleic acid-binding protein